MIGRFLFGGMFMIRDRQEAEALFQKSETYILEHEDVRTMSIEELMNHFDDLDFDAGLNWGVIACVYVNSLEWNSNSDLIDLLADIDVVPLVKEYIGYLLVTRHGVNAEHILLVADKTGKYEKLHPYFVYAIAFQSAFQDANILEISLLINKHIKDNSGFNLLLNYVKHIENYDCESKVIEELVDVDFEMKNDILSKLSSSWIKKADQKHIEYLKSWFDSGDESKIYTALCLIESASDNQKTFEVFYDQILHIGIIFLSTRKLLISIFIKYILEKNDRNKIYEVVLNELDSYLLDNDNITVFIEKISYTNLNFDLRHLFERSISLPLANMDRLYDAIDSVICLNYKKGESNDILSKLFLIYRNNNTGINFSKFIQSFNSSWSLIPTNSVGVWKYVMNKISSQDIIDILWACKILLYKFNFDSEFMTQVENLDETFTIEQIANIINLMLYSNTEAENLCRLYFYLSSFNKSSLDKYITLGVEIIYASYPGTMTDVAIAFTNSEFAERRHAAEVILEHNKQQQEERKTFLQVKDFWPTDDREKIYRKSKIAFNKEIHKMSEKQSIFLLNTVHLKYGKRMGFITHRGRKQLGYSSSEPTSFSVGFELPRQYQISPVDYWTNKMTVLQGEDIDEIDS